MKNWLAIVAMLSAASPLLVTGCGDRSAGSHPAAPLPFIEDDYPRAVAEARARSVPIFVESWAPW